MCPASQGDWFHWCQEEAQTTVPRCPEKVGFLGERGVKGGAEREPLLATKHPEKFRYGVSHLASSSKSHTPNFRCHILVTVEASKTDFDRSEGGGAGRSFPTFPDSAGVCPGPPALGPVRSWTAGETWLCSPMQTGM